jgi:nicotinamide-nucleotide amidase
VKGGRALPNAQGSAPGQLIRAAGPDGRPRLLALLPGPTHEFAPMLRALVLPELKRELGARPVPRLDLHVAGLMEATVDEAVRPVLRRHKDLRATILGGWGLVHLHFGAERAASLEDVRRTLKRSLAGHLYGEGAATLASASLERLLKRGESLATAESCTGGLIAKDLTDVPGSSRSFVGGLVAYANALKTAELGVSPALIKRFGAVSGHCAKAMAAGARRRYRADWGLAATGVAGPGGGTRSKPVGRVWLAVAGPRRTQALRFDFAGDRDAVRRRAATLALYLLWKELGRR